MDAGPELDALVAKAVFGRTWTKYPYVVINDRRRDLETWLDDGNPENPGGGTFAGQMPPEYSRSIAVAWTVVERLRKDFTRVEIHLVDDIACVLLAVGDEVTEAYPVTAEAATAPLAICLAALEAVATKERGI